MYTDDYLTVNAVLHGDKDGYEKLVDKYKKMVYGIAWSHLGDPDLSEDAAQETFVKAYTYLGTLREPDRFAGWLARIARNVCGSLGRGIKRENAFHKNWAVLASTEAEPQEEDRGSLSEQLWDSFAKLPAIHREALTLFYVEGKSIAEASAALGIAEQTMRTRLHRARTALRAQLEQMLEESLSDLQPSRGFTRSVLVLLPMTPKGAIGAGGALAVFGKLFASLSFVLWIAAAQALAMLGLFTMYSKLDEASLEDTPENRPIKAFIRRDYMKAVAAMFVTFVVFGLLILHHRVSALSALLQISSIGYAYITWRAFRLLRVNTSTAVIGNALAVAIIFIAVVAFAFFQASFWLFFIAALLGNIIAYFTTQKTPQRFGCNLFTGSAMGIFGDFEDDQSLGRRLTRTELLSFAKFLGGLWLVQDYRWRADGITLLLNIGGLPLGKAAASRVTITWDGACTATMSAKHLKVTRQLLVGRSVEATELQDNACRVVRYALNCFLRGDLEAARKVFSPDETPSAQSLTAARHNRVKSLVGVWLGIVCIVMFLVMPLVEPSEKEKELHHLGVGAYCFLIVPAVGFLVAILAMAITLRRTRRGTARSDGEDGDRMGKKWMWLSLVCVILIVGLVVCQSARSPVPAPPDSNNMTPARMTVNDTLWALSQGSPRCVYEITQDEKRADAIRYIEGTRNLISPGQELIDAGTADDSTLREKLKGGFILFATMGGASRLFKAAIQPLNIQIEGGKMQWGDLTVPITDDLRIMLVGKNPYGDGYCVVFAAGSNASLVGVNGAWASRDCSCAISQGGKVLKEANYSTRFVLAGDCIPQAEAVADVSQFFSTLQRVHPDLLAKVDLKDYIKLKQQTLDGIAGKLDKDGKISVEALAYLLYYAAAYFQDGHTSVQWQSQPNESNTQGKQFAPFILRCENGQFVVAGAENRSIEGLEITSIDGKPIREFLKPVLDRCSGETLTFKASRFTNNQSFWYSFTNLFGSAPSLALGLRDTKGKESEQKVETVGFAEFRKLESNKPDKKQQRIRKQGTRVYFYDSDKIAHFVYPAFTMSDDEKKKIDGIFNEIRAEKSQDLIIDIRGNEGGNSRMGDLVFSYLYGQKFRTFSKGRVKLSRDVLQSVAKDWKIPEDAELDGVIVTSLMDEQSFPKPRAFFSGRAFLLVDNGTFSSASEFAAMVRDYGVGKILGYETGGIPCCFGDTYGFGLKNSGISCAVSWKQFFGPKPRPGDDQHGILPDIAMSSELLRAYQNEEDPVLALTLDHIKKTREKPRS